MGAAKQRLVLLAELGCGEHSLLSVKGTGWGRAGELAFPAQPQVYHVWFLTNEMCSWVSMCPCGYGDC